MNPLQELYTRQYLNPAVGTTLVTISGAQTTYTIISDVPEPSTLTLLGIGVSGLLAFVWRRRK